MSLKSVINVFIHKPFWLELQRIFIFIGTQREIPSIPAEYCALFKVVSVKFKVLGRLVWKSWLSNVWSPTECFFDYRVDDGELINIVICGETFGIRSTNAIEIFTNTMDPGHICCSRCNEEIILISRCIGASFHNCSCNELLLCRVLKSVGQRRRITKSYFDTMELNFVAKHSLLVPSSTDLSNSAKNLLYTLNKSTLAQLWG